jgi:hypothetical protein
MSIFTRKATLEDIPWLMVELEKFAKFFGTHLSLFNPETAPGVLTNIIKEHVFLIAYRKTDGERLGFVAGLLSPHLFNKEIIQLTELFWWVPEEYRRTGAGHILFEEFLKVGVVEADWVNFTLETNSPVKDEFLLRRGFKPQERSFILEVQ